MYHCDNCKSQNYFVDEWFIICSKCYCQNKFKLNIAENINYLEYKKKTWYNKINYLSQILMNINSFYEIDKQIIDNVKLYFEKNKNLEINYFNIRKYFSKKKQMYIYIPTIIKILLNLKQYVINNDDIYLIKYYFFEINKYINKYEIIVKRKKFLSYNFILFIIFTKLKMNNLKIFILYP